MNETNADYQTMVKAHIAAQDYRDARSWYAEAENSYVRERRVFRAMAAFFVVIAVPILLIALYYVFTTSEGAELVAQYGLGYGLFASIFVSVLFGSVPAGYIGLWRAANRSAAPLLIRLAFYVFVGSVLCAIPMCFGFCFFISQAWRTWKVRSELNDAKSVFACATERVA